jgi:trk system potassium uptake protein
MSEAKQLYVVIVGCGRLGSYLAERLSQGRQRVMVIDTDADALGRLSLEYSGFQLEGDASELAVLTEANVAEADVLIVTTHRQNTNLLVGQIAKKLLGVPRVIARVSDIRREDIYRELGIDTVCAVSMLGDAILGDILPSVVAAEEGDEP